MLGQRQGSLAEDAASQVILFTVAATHFTALWFGVFISFQEDISKQDLLSK